MLKETRTVTSGDKQATYTLNKPENVAEFINLLRSDDTTADVTVNVSGLLRLAEYAMKAYVIEQDNAARLTLSDKGNKRRMNDRFGLGF